MYTLIWDEYLQFTYPDLLQPSSIYYLCDADNYQNVTKQDSLRRHVLIVKVEAVDAS